MSIGYLFALLRILEIEPYPRGVPDTEKAPGAMREAHIEGAFCAVNRDAQTARRRNVNPCGFDFNRCGFNLNLHGFNLNPHGFNSNLREFDFNPYGFNFNARYENGKGGAGKWGPVVPAIIP